MLNLSSRRFWASANQRWPNAAFWSQMPQYHSGDLSSDSSPLAIAMVTWNLVVQRQLAKLSRRRLFRLGSGQWDRHHSPAWLVGEGQMLGALITKPVILDPALTLVFPVCRFRRSVGLVSFHQEEFSLG